MVPSCLVRGYNGDYTRAPFQGILVPLPGLDMRKILQLPLLFVSIFVFGACSGIDGRPYDPDGAGGSAAGAGGGSLGSGGGANTGGTLGGGGSFGSGGGSTGGQGNSGGGANGGGPGSGGGFNGSGGGPGPGAGGGPSTGGGAPFELDCDAEMPTSTPERHSGNGVGGDDHLAWEIWSNTGNGELFTYPGVAAFTASWNNAGGYLGRMGYEWGGFQSNPVPYEEHGTITAHIASRKSGTAGGYSYVGLYGWSTDPCVEWYIVEDSYNNMPINPGMTTNKGEVELDGGTYIMYTRPTTGTGGTRCSGVNNWIQYYSVRRTARACGTVSVTGHFDAWKSLGMELGDMLEVKIIAEVGGGVGEVDFPVALLTETP